MAPPTTTSTRAATIARIGTDQPPHDTQCEYRRQREEHHYRVLLITARGTGHPDSIGFLAWHALPGCQLTTTMQAAMSRRTVIAACSRSLCRREWRVRPFPMHQAEGGSGCH